MEIKNLEAFENTLVRPASTPVSPDDASCSRVASQIGQTRSRVVPISRPLLRQHRVIAGYDPGLFVDAYKVLRTKVLQRMREKGWNCLAVTSPNPGAGNTLTAINLAISMAAEVGQHVLLVDANLRNPSVHHFFGFDPQCGLNDYLLDHVPLNSMLIRPEGLERLTILPGTRPLLESSEMLSSPRMIELVNELKTRDRSRIVVFDLPHFATSDALAFTPYVDAAVLVLEEGKTTHDEIQHAFAHFQSTALLGTVLNKADIPMPNGLETIVQPASRRGTAHRRALA